LTFSIYQG